MDDLSDSDRNLDILPLDIIVLNLLVFKNIKEYEKLMIESDGTVHVDDRYFQSIRRRVDEYNILNPVHSDRDSTYIIIKNTYNSIHLNYDFENTNRNLILESLENLLKTQPITYPKYRELIDLIVSLQNEFKRVKIDKWNAFF